MSIINKIMSKSIPALPKWFAKIFAGPYVAGENIDLALEHVAFLNKKGYAATIDILGEHTRDTGTAKSIAEAYCDLLKKIDDMSLDCNLSIKPSHIGLDISQETAIQNFKKIINIAQIYSNFIRLDMEDSSQTDNTLEIFKDCNSHYNKTGVVIQAYLKRSIKDLEKLADSSFNARICKGIYKENRNISYHDPEEIRDNFIRLAEIMISRDSYVCFATHDLILIDKILSIIKNKKTKKDKYEFQVLYGVPMGSKLRELIKQGHKVRVYVPFGSEWYDYSIRRIKENPNIASYVLKNLFKKNSY